MKKLFTFAIVTLGASLALVQVVDGSAKKLNPQPLPPGRKATHKTTQSKVALNPQPLPPGAKSAPPKPAANNKVNPQPLPPGAQKTATGTPK